MNIDYKPWEWVTIIKDGSYQQVRADEVTRQKQLAEFKKKRKAELKKELSELDNLI